MDEAIVRDARVMVVGCGALGNEVLKNLVLSGVGHIIAVDFDRVEIGNLPRSVLFRKEDAEKGRLKVDVAAQRLREYNPRLDIQTIDGDVAYDVGLDIFRKVDVVVSCVDSRWARFMINRHCMRTGTPWVDGGIDGHEGTARVFVPGKNCYACSLGPQGLRELHRRFSCSNTIRRMELSGSVPVTVVAASVIGAVQAQETLKLLAREESICGRMFYYEGSAMSSRMVQFLAYDSDCAEHEQWGPFEDGGICISHTVRSVLESLGAGSSIILRDDCFADFVERKSDAKCYPVMCPGRRVADVLEQNRETSGIPLGEFYQSEYRVIDGSFPYGDLTLEELGIPHSDVLHVRTGGNDRYIIVK